MMKYEEISKAYQKGQRDYIEYRERSLDASARFVRGLTEYAEIPEDCLRITRLDAEADPESVRS